MATTFHRSSSKPVPGGGNRHPLPPSPFGGGGGGGGGRGDGDGVRGFQQQLQRYRLGLLLTIASIVMVFISFTTLFVARRGSGRFDPVTGTFQTDWVSVPLPMKLLLINTLALLVSSGLIEFARRAARRDSILVPLSAIPGVLRLRQTSLWWVWATILAGTGFLFGQYRAWMQLHLVGAGMIHNPARTFMLLLTGTHALHLIAGLVVLLYACLASGPRHSLERRCITLDVSAWYWHFMAIMWVYVFLVLKLLD